MPKSSGKLLFSALLKAFKSNVAEVYPATSGLPTINKLLNKPYGNPPTSPNSSSVPTESSKRAISSLADMFVLQLKKTSPQGPAQESCAEITSFDDPESPTTQANFEDPCGNQYLNGLHQRKKETSRFRKQKVILKNVKSRHFLKLMEVCGEKLDVESTLGLFGRLGRQISLKEYKTLITLWLGKARSINVKDSLGYLQKLFHLFKSMRERGFQIPEDCYGPLFVYMIDMRMRDEFKVFTDFIKDYDDGSYTKLGYYEMLFLIKIGDKCRIKELCSSIAAGWGADNNKLAESYLLALCENDMEEELIQLLEAFDMGGILSLELASCISKSIGRLKLENFIEKFILAFKIRGTEEENISCFIYDYASSIPNLAVEDIISKFEKLHEKIEVIPTVASWDKLIKLSCNLSKVQVSLDIADRMCRSGLVVSVESFHPILHACEQTSEFDLVHHIYSVICRHNLKPSGDTFKSLIVLCTKMKDFEGAYNLLKDAREMKVMPMTGMYNAVMAAYFREKNNYGALMVLQQMQDLNIKPDSETYSYMISNCGSEEDIVKYYDEMQHTGVQATKYVYMALINAYATFGKFEKAKQVIRDADIPHRYLNEIRSVLVSALSSNGQISEALIAYDEIKQAGDKIQPKAAISLIENLQNEGNLDRLQQLLDDLIESSYWFDGCSRVVLYCVRHNLARTAVELLEDLKKKDESSTYIVIDQVFSGIWSNETTNLEIGLELLRAIKEELHLCVSRISLDFLLSTCVKAKDALRAQLVWSEYEVAGLPYNILTFLRMYQALLASGDINAASNILKRITKDDPHVRYVIESCKATYSNKHYNNPKIT
ncbi:pentatricopeptide repeat-containing protein At4g04790, mitochondrial isoform X2 [Phalaenopsis equestris]|uniref:pentatricopeptide repeat-containing protein At4g04790, mitochondrial isoform X2 n=1 Tax=Phalaenopsis equestris TaxID=78828 RepID=UPI0009E3CD2E|nr:pentatricopeptide repeat-containing protein At4g04790, mitochondrial isoform X2 [Phalaenopsis equestris]